MMPDSSEIMMRSMQSFASAIRRVFATQCSSVWSGLLVYISEVTISAPSALAICAK